MDDELARLRAEIEETRAGMAEARATQERILRMEEERWERLAMPEPSYEAALEPGLTEPGGEEPFRTLMGFAIRGELQELAAQVYAHGEERARVLLGLAMSVACYIVFDVSGRYPPTEADVRAIAEITMRNELLCDLRDAGEDPEFALPVKVNTGKLCDYLDRAVLRFEDISTVFPPMEAGSLPLLFTSAMLAAFRPAGTSWWQYLDQIWDAMLFARRVPLAVLPALHLRAHKVATLGARPALPPAT